MRYDKLLKSTLWDAFLAEKARLDRLDSWYRWDHALPVSAKSSSKEHNELRARSQTPIGNLIVTAAAQELYVEGYRRTDNPKDSGPWQAWQANGLDSRQIALHRAALAYGEAYNLVLPGKTTLGESIPRITGISPRRMVTFWEDPATDWWPRYALWATPAGGQFDDTWSVKIYDEEAVFEYLIEGATVTPLSFSKHSVGVCPIVRFANQLDLDGRTPGEVEPFIPIMQRIDQTTFDRLLVQRHSSWRVRTIAGMTPPSEAEKKAVRELELSIKDILIASDPDTRFGTLEATGPEGFIKATQFELKLLAAVSQTPAYELLGDLINLSAEALVAARYSLTQKITERKHGFGQSHEQTLRLAARVMGDHDAASDWSAQVLWKDTEGRSLGQAADALGKLATMLGVPVEMLWEKIPGWTQTDVERAKTLVQEGDSIGALLAELAAGATPTSREE